MNAAKNAVQIKGTKDGLTLILNEHVEFADLVGALQSKIRYIAHDDPNNTKIPITVDVGNRALHQKNAEMIKNIIESGGHLKLHKINSNVVLKQQHEYKISDILSHIKFETKTVRSGQVLEHKGSLVLLADVNPGGTVKCTGSVFVLGALNGIAHAGCKGDEQSIICAAKMTPTQLRIASTVCVAPEGQNDDKNNMQFAYLNEGNMVIDHINKMFRVCPNLDVDKMMKQAMCGDAHDFH